MCNCFRQVDLNLFPKLRGAGIPLDDEVVRSLEASGKGLYIFPSLIRFESYVTDLKSGGTGYALSVEIYNDSNRVIWPCAYRLTPLANERQFRWLEVSLDGPKVDAPYRFPGETKGGFASDEVLNHHVGRRYRLYPRDSLEGYLLGAGLQPLPPEYRNGQLLDVTLSIFDQRDVCYEANMQLMVDRKVPAKKLAAKGGHRRLRDLICDAEERKSRRLKEVA
jgi:hypothetical protein